MDTELTTIEIMMLIAAVDEISKGFLFHTTHCSDEQTVKQNLCYARQYNSISEKLKRELTIRNKNTAIKKKGTV